MSSDVTLRPEIVGVPAHLASAPKADSAERQLLLSNMRPSAIKILQALSSHDLLASNKPGSVISTSDGALLSLPGEELDFIPLVMRNFWAGYNPKGVKPYIVETTYDPDTDCARKAANMEDVPIANSREVVKYRPGLIFMVLVKGQTAPMILRCAKGDYGAGQQLSSLIFNRAGGLTMCASRFSLRTWLKPGQLGEWWTPKFDNAASPWVTEEELKVALAFQKVLHDQWGQLDLSSGTEDTEDADASAAARAKGM